MLKTVKKCFWKFYSSVTRVSVFCLRIIINDIYPPFFVLFVLTFAKPSGNVSYISLML